MAVGHPNGSARQPYWPTLFIIGAPRAGTTSLSSMVGQHPQVHFSDPKEPFFFAESFPRLRERQGISDENRYHRLFAGRHPETIGAEGSTLYLACPTAPASIRERVEGPRLIATIRTPEQLVPSLHRHLSMQGIETRTLSDAWNSSSSGRRRIADARGVDELLLDYRQMFRLGEQIARLKTQFQKHELLILHLDQIKFGPAEALARIWHFAGLDPSPFVPPHWHNTSRQARSQRLETFLKSPPTRAITRRIKTTLPPQAIDHLRRARDRATKRQPTPDDRRFLYPTSLQQDIELYFRADYAAAQASVTEITADRS